MVINAAVQESGLISFHLSSSRAEVKETCSFCIPEFGAGFSQYLVIYMASQSGFRVTVGQYSPMHIKDDLKMYSSLLFSDFSFNFCKPARVQFGDSESLKEGLSVEK